MTIDEFVEHWGDDWGATTLPFVKADIGKLLAAERERCAKNVWIWSNNMGYARVDSDRLAEKIRALENR